VTRLFRNIVALFQTRVDMAKQDAQAMVRSLIVAVTLCAVAVLLLVMALPIALATLILALALWVPPWAATAIVCVVIVALAGALFFVGRRRFARRWSERLLNGIREDWKAIRDELERRP